MSNIPKIIHYCWFGKNELPGSAKKCIESWKKFCPDYEIQEWNESNYDVFINKYSESAYLDGKYAFVADYARYWILYQFGGIYLDTDVELIKPLDDLVQIPFMGMETCGKINPGLIMGAEAGMSFYREVLDYYNGLSKYDYRCTVVDITSDILLKHGLIQENIIQQVFGLIVYPIDYFNPMGEKFQKIVLTKNTYSIHHYDASWKSRPDKTLMRYRQRFGYNIGTILFCIVHPIHAWNKRRK